MLPVLDTNHLRELREDTPPGRKPASRIEGRQAEPLTCVVVAEEILHRAFLNSRRT